MSTSGAKLQELSGILQTFRLGSSRGSAQLVEPLISRGYDDLAANAPADPPGVWESPDAQSIGRPMAGDRMLAAARPFLLLDLSSTQVTDAGLKHLSRMKELRMLLLTNTRVTERGVNELRKALPELEDILY